MRNRLLIFRSFAHNAQRVLTAVERLALVGVERSLEFGLRAIVTRLIGVELQIAALAHSKSVRWMLHDPQIAFRHNPSLAQCQGKA
jgi:hypothetical protein